MTTIKMEKKKEEEKEAKRRLLLLLLEAFVSLEEQPRRRL
jgi:hypothetical protein